MERVLLEIPRVLMLISLVPAGFVIYHWLHASSAFKDGTPRSLNVFFAHESELTPRGIEHRRKYIFWALLWIVSLVVSMGAALLLWPVESTGH